LALIAGGIIASRITTLAEMVTIKGIALVLLILYFVYYVWVYFGPQARDE
jgi:cbb3-type cytochrome oxidase subunit 3